MTSLKLSKFNLKNIDDDSIVVTIAKRKSGKTVLIKQIAHSKRKFACGVLMCPTERMNKDYKMFFPDLFIHYDVSVNLIARVIERQMLMVDKMDAKHQQGLTVDPRMLLIMDDCMSEKGKWRKDPIVNRIFVEGRHYKITYVLAMQNPMDVGPELRGNMDYVFLLRCKSKSEREKLRVHYASVVDAKIFREVFDKCTENYGCMVVDVNAGSTRLEDNIFYYRVSEKEMHRKFVFGDKKFVAYHEHYYDPDWNKRGQSNRLKDLLKVDGPAVILR